MPAMINGADWPPVNGSEPPFELVTTVVEVMNGDVVVVVDTTTVDPATRSVVVVSGMVVVVVVSTPAVVVDCGSVVVVVDVVRGTVVVVVSWVCLVVVVTGTEVVVLLLVEVLLLVDVLLDVLDVLLDVVLLLVVDEELEVTGTVGPQNCTLEMPRVNLPLPNLGRPEFEKFPSNCGGAIHETADLFPPVTTMAETPSVECHAAPALEVPVTVTTFEFPAGVSKT
jgi:hypothetical protein